MRPLDLAVTLALLCACTKSEPHTLEAPSAALTASTPPSSIASAMVEIGADGIGWQLAGAPATTFKMANRGVFALSIVASNGGSKVTDTRRDRLEYLVNGRPSMMLSMAFGNGLRENRWSALAPGEIVREARGGSGDPTFGAELFPSPGEYDVVLRQDGRNVATLHVRVDRD